MTLRISGQVPFEDVKALFEESDDVFRIPYDHDDALALARWALERFGRHLKSCPFGRTTDDRFGHQEQQCTCGLAWAREQIGCSK